MTFMQSNDDTRISVPKLNFEWKEVYDAKKKTMLCYGSQDMYATFPCQLCAHINGKEYVKRCYGKSFNPTC
jgi:hypothetical protein